MDQSRQVSSTADLAKLHRNQEPEDQDDVVPKKEKGQLGLSTLHDTQDEAVIADIIFIHGLGGGSIKTWSDSSGKTTVCWPRDWLPGDPDFQHVRIHTFGYDADWKDKVPSILSVHDFAQILLGEMKNHHQIGKGSAGIIFVCHSMGGCVAKKTYILVREDPTCKDLAARVHSMFFLATPHRGSDLGKALRGVLLLNGLSKPYAEDLVQNSGPVLEVNETFRDIASGLHIWSFFESLPVLGLTRKVVVSKGSATLGLPNEEVSSMDADHRRVCKFAQRGDHNYRRVRNALVTAIDTIKFECFIC
ncbi:Protein SERAC1 [Escovopsis weberi]|uniref:Protein SERAC1 n=1 Tax=Escovopsis weberi TaxID=150374 RepID=A0A0M8MXD3_ESCWE|nr:Protein SERAC1 [Escovopsis weberi]